jgi:prepilin-type N-terminal cleavage/methylation domain-containing protein
MGRPARKTEQGLTLIEMMIALALLGVVVLGVTSLFGDFEQARSQLASRTDAHGQSEVLFQRVSRLFRTRLQNAGTAGYEIESCTGPGQKASCLDVLRRRPSAGKDVIERFRVKNVCIPLKSSEQRALAGAGVSPLVVAESVAEMCGFKCASGQRPAVVIRHWPDRSAGGRTADVVFPSGRFGIASAVGAGFCARETSDSEALFLFGVTYLREGERGYKTLLAKKELVAPTKEDESKIEWLP